MAKPIMIQGTMSNAGKSVLTGGLLRVLAQDGVKADSVQIPEHGIEFIHYRRRPGNGKGAGDAGGGGRY